VHVFVVDHTTIPVHPVAFKIIGCPAQLTCFSLLIIRVNKPSRFCALLCPLNRRRKVAKKNKPMGNDIFINNCDNPKNFQLVGLSQIVPKLAKQKNGERLKAFPIPF